MNGGSSRRVRGEIDMRTFANGAGATIHVASGDTVIETIGANEALGFMSMVDDLPRSSTARAREACELSLIDAHTFRFMVDEVPNFSTYIMRMLARRIRGMSRAM